MIEFDRDEVARRVLSAALPDLEAMVRYSTILLSHMCESPIEVALGSALMLADRLEHEYLRYDFALAWNSDEKSYRDDISLLIPQFQWNQYRIDFAIRSPRQSFKYLFIECDGHDFHERTKEQAARDRSRDRAIQTAGYPVLRFTGSEIHKDVSGCAHQVLDFLSERSGRLPKG